SHCARCAIQKRSCRNGRRLAAFRPRTIVSWRARDHTTILNSAWPSCYRTGRRRKVSAVPSAPPNRPPLPPCLPASVCRRTSLMADDSTRCGFIALIGAPNAGKSTLLNALVGSKVSIVSRKVQTTRALIRGIAIEGQAQLVFVDTPGIFAPKRRLDRAMVTTAWTGAHDADLVGVLIDARKGLDEEADAILSRLTDVGRPKILILNKIDLVPRDTLLTLTKAANDKASFEATFMISALKRDGVDDLKQWLAEKMQPGP